MSQQQHTPEPWSLAEVENHSGRIKHLVPVDGEKLSILTLVENAQAIFAAVYNDADARRIVACVNACAGIPNDELETAGRLAAAEEATLRRIQQQRDELLAEFNAYKEGSEEAFGTVVAQKQAAEARLQTMQSTIYSQQGVICNFREQRDELLAALEAYLPYIPTTSASDGGAARYSANVAAADMVRAAIASVKGGAA